MKSIRIEHSKRLFEDPGTGHNRWHPDIPPILEAAPGEEILLETCDAADDQVKPGMSVADLDQIDAKVAHPLTGPIWIQGAKPGDLLEIEYLDIQAQTYGWTRFRPGIGFLRDYFDGAFLAHWDIQDGLVLRHRDRNGRHRDRAVSLTRGRGSAQESALSAFFTSRLFSCTAVGRTTQAEE